MWPRNRQPINRLADIDFADFWHGPMLQKNVQSTCLLRWAFFGLFTCLKRAATTMNKAGSP
jgi:hypothetical protein